MPILCTLCLDAPSVQDSVRVPEEMSMQCGWGSMCTAQQWFPHQDTQPAYAVLCEGCGVLADPSHATSGMPGSLSAGKVALSRQVNQNSAVSHAAHQKPHPSMEACGGGGSGRQRCRGHASRKGSCLPQSYCTIQVVDCVLPNNQNMSTSHCVSSQQDSSKSTQ